MTRNWTKMLLAILLGNLVYWILYPHLPPSLVHSAFRIDAGLLLDFAICAVVYVGIKKIFR
jgi:hypothetical protein